MTVDGLSLVGFMPPEVALTYLGSRCVPADPAPQALQAEWQQARARLGAVPPRAGRPEVRDIPKSHQDHLRAVERSPRFAGAVGTARRWSFRLVEIAPLLTFQPDIANAGHQGLAAVADLAAQLRLCLPPTVEAADCLASVQAQSLLVYGDNPNLTILQAGASGPDPRTGARHGGILYGLGHPLVLVAQLGDRYYLRNGCHRLYQLARLGVAAAPCLVVEATDPAELGVPNGLDLSLLGSDHPPTCGHYADGRAHPVRLRGLRKVIHVSWSESIIYDPD